MIITKAAVALVAATYLLSAGAQDACRDVLALGMNQETRTSQTSTAEADRNYYCSATLSEARSYYNSQKSNSSSSSASGGISYGPFSITGGDKSGAGSSDSLTNEQYSKWKDDNCSQIERKRDSRTFEFEARKVVAQSVVAAWRDCMVNRRGLTCWFEEHQSMPHLLVSWSSNTDGRAVVKNSYIRGGTSVYTNTTKLWADNYTVERGEQGVPIIRNGDGKGEVEATMNVSHVGSANTCVAYLPAIKEAAATPAQPAIQWFKPPKYAGKVVCPLTGCKPFAGFVVTPSYRPAADLKDTVPAQFNLFLKE